MKFVLDTNLFNRLADGRLTLNDLPQNSQFVATHIQVDEINATRNEARKEVLLNAFKEIAPDIIPTESGVWDVSRWDEFKWGDGITFRQIKM
ncbi:MAG TPA: hypothetical protein VHP13_09205, partial [Gammaproteobacteria bacterium]|nr:hypothetical protein [Gammaproteobacteria bacterium]